MADPFFSPLQWQPVLLNMAGVARRVLGILLSTGLLALILIPLCWAFTDVIWQLLIEPLRDAADQLLPGSQSVEFAPTGEAFFSTLKLAAFAASVLATPYLSYRTAHWIAPGIADTNPAILWRFIAAASALFLGGAALVYFAILPLTLDYAISENIAVLGPQAGLAALPSADSYLGFAMKMILIIGLIFQAPAYFVLMARSGLATPRRMFRLRLFTLPALFLFTILALPPFFSAHLKLALPLVLIFELSAFMVRQIDRGQCLVSPPPQLEENI